MTVKSNQIWSGLIVTKDASGALQTPSVGPAGVLYVDGTANGASVTISGANPYKWTVTLPTLTAGQCVSMYITATIATIATGGVVAEDVADTAAPTAAANADAVWDELLSGHVIAGSTGAALTAAGAAAGGTLYSYSNTVDDGSGNLLDGVFIQLSSTSNFADIIATAYTNAIGAFTVRSDTAGTHYLRLQLAGYNFTDQTVTLA